MKLWRCILLILFLINGLEAKLYAQTTSKEKINTSANETTTHNRKIADSFFKEALHYQDTQAYQLSLVSFKKSLELYQLVGDGKKIGDCFNFMAISHFYLGDFSKAISSFEKAAETFRRIKYKKGVAQMLNNIGNVCNSQGNYLKALDHYRQSATLLEELGDEESLAVAIHNIGSIYVKAKDYNNAMSYFNKGYIVYKKTNNKERIAQILNAIGNTYEKQGKYTKASESLNKALQVADKMQNKSLQSSILLSLGDLFYEQAEYAKALQYYKRALAFSDQIGSLEDQAVAQIAIGQIMHRSGKNREAVERCFLGHKLSEKVGAMPVRKRGCECLYQAHKSLGNTQKALYFYEQANTLEDSLNLAETSNKVMGMEFQKQQLVDSLAQVKKEAVIQLKHQQEVQQREKQRNIIIITLCFILLIAAGLWNRLNFTRKSRAALKVEKDRSEALLLNILPEEIAEELKEKGSVNARDYNLVSILFTDFKSFTQTAETMSPQSLVEEINVCFRAFDLITEKYQIEKIKTIGDAYMAAGGIPHADESSLRNTVLAALEMQTFMVERYLENRNVGRPAFEMRLGIHAGPIVAGIVGVKKFQYDVWGDTVNTASRMESNSEVGRVNISDALYEYIKHEDCFRFEFRGHLHAKGKGDMAMYFVEKSSVAQLVA